MDISRDDISQYKAALEMLHMVVDAYPDSIWYLEDEASPFWQVAFPYRYFHPSDEAFSPWENHREQAYRLGTLSPDSDKHHEVHSAYSKAEMKEFLRIWHTTLTEMIP
jgi:hypothetical protein